MFVENEKKMTKKIRRFQEIQRDIDMVFAKKKLKKLHLHCEYSWWFSLNIICKQMWELFPKYSMDPWLTKIAV